MTTMRDRKKPVLRSRRIPRLRRAKGPGAPLERESDFARQMRESYERLRADPAAWDEWMEECASIDPLLVSHEYWEERERRRAKAGEGDTPRA